jgi:hypothetical protein
MNGAMQLFAASSETSTVPHKWRRAGLELNAAICRGINQRDGPCNKGLDRFRNEGSLAGIYFQANSIIGLT